MSNESESMTILQRMDEMTLYAREHNIPLEYLEWRIGHAIAAQLQNELTYLTHESYTVPLGTPNKINGIPICIDDDDEEKLQLAWGRDRG